MPIYMAKAGGFFFIVFGVIVAHGRAVADQPDLDLRALRPDRGDGRYRSPTGTSASLDGALRSCPTGRPVSGHHLSAGTSSFPASASLGLLVAHRSALYPFIERVDHRGQPRAPPSGPAAQRPTRTASAWPACYVLRRARGSAAATTSSPPLPPVASTTITGSCRSRSSSVPVIAFIVTKRICHRRCSGVTGTCCCTAGRPAPHAAAQRRVPGDPQEAFRRGLPPLLP